MSLGQRLAEIDQQLDGLGNVPVDLTERVRLSVSGSTLEAVDLELEALSTGVSFGVSTRSVAPPPAKPAAAPTVVAAPTLVAMPAPVAAPTPVAVPDASEAPPSSVEASEAPSLAAVAEPSTVDVPFVPTLPSEPPPGFETTVGFGTKARTLSMSEPPMSQPPPPESDAPPADIDPFEGRPAPIPVPQRAPSVWPAAPAPKRNTSRTIRTSVAPPPPLPPSASMRPRSMRPSDTPDPFAPPNLASSRPPKGLDGDQLFGGISSSPPAADSPAKFSAPPAPRVPSRAPQPVSATQRPAATDEPDGDDFELLVDDEMIEIDVDEE